MAAHLPIEWQGEPRHGHVECFYFFKRKDGKRGRVECHFVDCTSLCNCELCGRLGSPKRVHGRDVYGWNHTYDNYTAPTLTTLCMACWNRTRPIAELKQAVHELEYLIRKLKRTRPDGNHCGRDARDADLGD